jgi:cell division protease FtsH
MKAPIDSARTANAPMPPRAALPPLALAGEPARDIGADGETPQMGALEFAVYRETWRASFAYRGHQAIMAKRREAEVTARLAREQAVKAAAASLRLSGRQVDRRQLEERIDTLQSRSAAEKKEFPEKLTAPMPGRIAVALGFARLFDERPALLASVRSASPVILVDAGDPETLARLRSVWQDILFPEGAKVGVGDKLTQADSRETYSAISFVGAEPVGAKETEIDDAALFAVQLALPVFGFSLGAECLPKPLLSAASERIRLPAPDGATITRVIRIVTGRPCRDVLPEDVVQAIGLHELVLAVRFDRTPSECLAHLRELAARKRKKRESRDLSLDQLHGLDAAVSWAKSAMRDFEAWRAGDIEWDAVAHSVVLDGPTGTGKTTFARVFAAEMKLPLTVGSLAKWQSSGEAHLGHLLRAMRRDFAEARAQAPSVIFIDEVDSFPVRTSVKHSHRDYVVEVVNGFLEQLDSLADSNRGVFILAASNDVARCEPAILRSGRLSRVIRIGYPTPEELERMYRVRLGGDLETEGLRELSLLSVGCTGADVERIVNDARRLARSQERSLILDDLEMAVVGSSETYPDEALYRHAVHEAGHAFVAVHHFGPDGIQAVLSRRGRSTGSVWRMAMGWSAGTYPELARELEVILAGRCAEELLLGSAGQGAGGVDGSDLQIGTRLAAALVGSVGHAGPHPLLYLGARHETDAVLASPYLRVAVHREMAAADARARVLLESNKETLVGIANCLKSERTLSGAEIAALMKFSNGGGFRDPAAGRDPRPAPAFDLVPAAPSSGPGVVPAPDPERGSYEETPPAPGMLAGGAERSEE